MFQTIMSLTLIAVTCVEGQTPGGAGQAAAVRNAQYQDQLESYLREFLVDGYPARAERSWHRSYQSMQTFMESVEPNRSRYSRMLSPPVLRPSGPLERRPYPAAGVNAIWVALPLGAITAEGIFAMPENTSRPVPLVIAQHGITGSPDDVMGATGGAYKGYGRELLREGYAVLAIQNLRTISSRNRIERLARLAGTTVPGIELARMQALLDEILRDKRVDSGRVGIWGLSLGGMATMFWTPLEPRIKCAIVSGWFNHRRNKLSVPDPRYSCMLETTEDYAFYSGWLTEFTDSDVASLICPRPLLIQHGKKDNIAHWPQVTKEFEAARQHYQKLGIADRIELDMHEGGHEVRLETGMAFLERWLK